MHYDFMKEWLQIYYCIISSLIPHQYSYSYSYTLLHHQKNIARYSHQQTAPSLPQLIVIETTGEKHIQHWSEERFQIGPVQYQNSAIRIPRRFEHCPPIDSRSVSSRNKGVHDILCIYTNLSPSQRLDSSQLLQISFGEKCVRSGAAC